MFKLEFEGARGVALGLKCYFFEDEDAAHSKRSSKGVSHRQNPLSFDTYRKVLLDKTSTTQAKNIGFRMKDGDIATYAQKKVGLTAFYDKRRVHEDWVHTSPL